VNSSSVELLETPCTVHLTRTKNFVGSAQKVKVFLNGLEMDPLGNGQTIEMETDRVENMLFIQQGKNPVAVRRFNATSGGDINIEFSYFFGILKVIGEEKEE